jgi:hypothetical protein
MKKLLCIAVLALAACTPNSSSQVGADGYTFKQKQYEKHEVTIKIVTYKSPSELNRVVAGYLNKSTTASDHKVNSTNVVAFSLLQPPSYDTCTIHMMDPSVTYQPEFVGHEFIHCIYGQFHGDNTVNN